MNNMSPSCLEEREDDSRGYKTVLRKSHGPSSIDEVYIERQINKGLR